MRTNERQRRAGRNGTAITQQLRQDGFADLIDAIKLMKRLDNLKKEEARLEKEYPAGTCNHDDAWFAYFKEVRHFREQWDEFLKERGQ